MTTCDIIAEQAANALIPTATGSKAAIQGALQYALRPSNPGGRLLPDMVEKQIALQKTLQGGLWVGGRVRLTASELSFWPNKLNVKFHDNADALRVAIPLEQIANVRVRWGFISDIIDLETRQGPMSLRCFRAKVFARLIRDNIRD